MKRILSMALCACLCMCTVGCGESNDNQSELPIDTSLAEETVSYPRGTSVTAIELYNEYQSFAEEENFELTELTLNENSTSFYLNYEGTENQVFWYDNDKSFFAGVHADKNSTLEKEIITRLIMALDNISESTAAEYAVLLVTTNVTDNISEPVTIGDYIITYETLPYEDKSFNTLSFHHIDEIQKNDIDESHYPEIDIKTFKNELNYKEKCKLSGIVTESEISSPMTNQYYGKIVVMDDEFNEYLCEYNYSDMPVIFSPGDRCTIYGSINFVRYSDELTQCIQIESFDKS